MDELLKLLWIERYVELGYDRDLVERIIKSIEEKLKNAPLPKKDNAVIRQASPPWEHGRYISAEEKQKRDKQNKAFEDTKRSMVRDLTLGMVALDPKLQEGVAAFNALHVYNPVAALEWGFPIQTATGLGTGYMLGDMAGEKYGKPGQVIGGLVGGLVGGAARNPGLPNTKIVPTLALAYQLNRGRLRPTEPLLNVGWGPRQTIEVSHLAETPITLFRVFNPDQWGVASEGLNPLGIWFSPRLEVGTPRMNPRKRLKAARARAVFLTRPWLIEGDLTLNKPMVTIGDVPNRSALEYAAELAGADGVIFNNIYDNGFDATTSIKSFVEPTITGINSRPRIAYYGPTMGKTTFTKRNPNLPFDDADRIASKEVLWEKRKLLALDLGINPRDFGTNRVPEEIANSLAYKEALDEYLASLLDSMSAYVADANNVGRTLLTSNRHVLNPNNRVHLSNTPSVPDFNTFLARNQLRGFKETPEQVLEWWKGVVEQPGVQIDNRYVSDILADVADVEELLSARGPISKNPQSARILGLKGLTDLRDFYQSVFYKQRIKQAYPNWTEARINRFIQNKVNDVDEAIKLADFSHSVEELNADGNTTIVNSRTGQKATKLQVANNASDPRRVAIHEGLHFTSKGGENPKGPTNPDTQAIVDFNNEITPEFTRSFYKLYLEAGDKAAFKLYYLKKMQELFPSFGADDLEALYLRMLKKGAYYNHTDEMRSLGLTDVVKAWKQGEIQNINDVDEVYDWLVKAFENNTLDPNFKILIRDFRQDFELWALFLTKALSIGSIPVIADLASKQNETLEQ